MAIASYCNSNFHLIRSKILLTNHFKITVSNLCEEEIANNFTSYSSPMIPYRKITMNVWKRLYPKNGSSPYGSSVLRNNAKAVSAKLYTTMMTSIATHTKVVPVIWKNAVHDNFQKLEKWKLRVCVFWGKGVNCSFPESELQFLLLVG